MSTYKFHALDGGDWTIQRDSGNIIEGSSNSQAVAAVESGKVVIRTYYPYYEAKIDLATNTIQIDNVNVTGNGAAAIVEQLNEEVFVGSVGGGGGASSKFAFVGEDDLASEDRYIDFGGDYEMHLDGLKKFLVTLNNDSYWTFNPNHSYYAIYAADDGSAYQDMIGNTNESFVQIGARRSGFTKNSDLFIGAHETLGNYIKAEVVTPTYDSRIWIDQDGISFRRNNAEIFGLGINAGYGGVRTISVGNNGRNDPNPNNSTFILYDEQEYDGTNDVLTHWVGGGSYQAVTKTNGGDARDDAGFGWCAEFIIGADNTSDWAGDFGLQGGRFTVMTRPGSTGTITKAVGLLGGFHLEGMDITTGISILAQQPYRPGGGTLTNSYGLLIEPHIGATNNRNILSQGSTSLNEFEGNMRFTKFAGNGAGYLAIDNSGNLSWSAGSGGGGGSDVFTKTLAADGSDNNVQITSTSSGSSAGVYQVGLFAQMLPGYTGTGASITAQFNNTTAGTGTDPYTNDYANFAVYGIAASTTTGFNVGIKYSAQGGDANIGGLFMAKTAKNDATNIGMAALALNTGSGSDQVAGYFGLKASITSLVSAALIADNGATTSPIFLARDNSSTVFSILDGGTVQYYNTSAPGTPTGGAYQWAESGEMKVKDTSGNTTTISPHNFSGIPEGQSEEMAWAFYSEKDGKYVNVDMLKLARTIEKLSGEKLVYIGNKN